MQFLSKERKKNIIFPPKKEVFNAFLYTDFNKIKVVIIGQDPYFNFNQAHGLAFSIKKDVSLIPPSLRNIQIEVSNNFNIRHNFRHGCLDSWAYQGVFLLNSILTVERGKALSHGKLGWEIFTDQVIRYINQYCYGVIFLLWGLHAKKKNI